ncbi:ABC transporter ATP-binding protein [Pontibacter akesuensis]|uniref:Phospholipid/cholesterol/gamma-HCH transport system ATP-binding protein n=1 Tax=Pontibacter akesuensis TaxID=388950 RepID=A0A1I7GDI4_9BACT|nr:ATP-binding cassette domain-containing protein [Pontibacter akesuensis]GHA57364.1 ABC transporter ATP-binding protein [Pontibacter akesuensis]SFU46517.1 phospholipid/cholesterol/gamma-HCH transport system ATP-binding protein [Pontibacter akesuensis]
MKKINPKINRENNVIEIRGLKKAFDDFVVLKEVNLDLYQGENLVVLGRSGTGKSVLIKIISGLLRPDEGVVNVLGQQVDKLTPKELDKLRLRIGFSFQNSALYDSMTVRENLEFPLIRHSKSMTKAERDELVQVVLEAVGLSQTINQMPSELSGGQRKRIGIARTLILKPDIMLYDEPTAGLDPITCIEINKLINQVQERFNTSSIIITHDLTCARAVGDRMVMLLDGEFKREGTFEEVFSSDDERVKMFYDYNFVS